MRIILVRHGETEWNVNKRVQGRTDTELNETGRRQARSIGERLISLRFNAIYSSPLKRAHDTALEIAAHHSCDVFVRDELTEINFGAWEGKTDVELRRDFAEYWNDWNWIDNPDMCQRLGAENGKAIFDRALDALNDIIKRHDENDSVVIVSHTMPLKMIIADSIGLPTGKIRRIRLDNCGYNEIVVENGKRSLVTLNEITHLVERKLK